MAAWKIGVLVCLALCAGCGSTDKLCAVQGKVTLAGAALDQGTITFYQVPDSQVPAGGALIQNGKYAIAADRGLEPGKYRATISATEGATISPADYAAGKSPLTTAKERIPAKYNTKSELVVEVSLGKTNQLDFALD